MLQQSESPLQIKGGNVMIPIYVNIQKGVEVTLQGKCFSGECSSEEVGIKTHEEEGKLFLKEPFNSTICSMDPDGLNAVNVVVGASGVHVLGNYEPEFTTARCCVTLCGTTVCCKSACVTCGSTTVCC